MRINPKQNWVIINKFNVIFLSVLLFWDIVTSQPKLKVPKKSAMSVILTSCLFLLRNLPPTPEPREWGTLSLSPREEVCFLKLGSQWFFKANERRLFRGLPSKTTRRIVDGLLAGVCWKPPCIILSCNTLNTCNIQSCLFKNMSLVSLLCNHFRIERSGRNRQQV